MRKLFVAIGLSVLLLTGSGTGYASTSGRGQERQEQRGKINRNQQNSHNSKKNTSAKKNQNKQGQHSVPRPGNVKPSAPVSRPGHSAPRPGAPQPSAPAVRPGHHAPHPAGFHGGYYPDRLAPMIRYATRGCWVEDVWQVDANTFVVKYRRGNRYYTQYLYPYANRYGAVQVLGNGWVPLSGWISIPLGIGNLNLQF